MRHYYNRSSLKEFPQIFKIAFSLLASRALVASSKKEIVDLYKLPALSVFAAFARR
jgi:hypothetical protein